MTQMIRRTLATLVLAAALPALAAAQEAAPDNRNVEARETPWQVTCAPTDSAGTLGCSMSKSLILPEGNRVLAQAAVIGGEILKMRVMAPHGLAIPEGLTIKVDDREIAKVPFNTSLPAGVIAVVELTPEIEGALRFGSAMSVTATQNNGAAFVFTMSLVGFSASIEKVR
jgi:invasion protein IalB